MSRRNVIELIKAHLPHLPQSLHLPRALHIQDLAELDEAYLNESVDLYDLERRLHEVEARDTANTASLMSQGSLH